MARVRGYFNPHPSLLTIGEMARAREFDPHPNLLPFREKELDRF
jgi:hypothetical protein